MEIDLSVSWWSAEKWGTAGSLCWEGFVERAICYLLVCPFSATRPPARTAPHELWALPTSILGVTSSQLVHSPASVWPGEHGNWELKTWSCVWREWWSGCCSYCLLLIFPNWRAIKKCQAAYKDVYWWRGGGVGVQHGRLLQEHLLDSFHSPFGDSDWWHLVSPCLSLPWYHWQWGWGK